MLDQRNHKREHRAFAFLAFHVYASAMHQGDPAHNMKAEARSSGFAGTRLIHPVKTFKDMLQMFGAHPDSIVFNTYGSLAAMMLCRHKHMTAVACIFNCIFNQIIDCLP